MPEHIWTLWWVWVVLGFGLGILEVIVPGFIFLGFAIGAVLAGVIAGFGLVESLPLLLLIFALASLLAWWLLRRVMGVRENQVKIWDRDINDGR